MLATPNINFMHVLEALGSRYPIKGHLTDPSGPILSTALTAVDPMAASMTTGHYWAFALYIQLISRGGDVDKG